ncbi:predicted protein [Aspergillus nidulans FGSC A4]|uniref:Transcription factor domain-containing protein n=1 Tax=Emericella nidulans (strain FGSC A4 / ATCC 38163 / CBS 112.46 / NRRL 194 / M139) TaxID=227321 RepID=Q5B1S4_EMENI|nr:hypothetical protein [Aspergillus nidulans FGSC A4]EAA62666.1 predicted protein [Aspergillus nidulans FGSC A4]CBF81779.1 TPA: conserved hypothetical protein [Aspergillus nidulans FGSC A4]|eukprot:XP_663110.1 predicted protein [Aspergillus nidulans FGSC A4]
MLARLVFHMHIDCSQELWLPGVELQSPTPSSLPFCEHRQPWVARSANQWLRAYIQLQGLQQRPHHSQQPYLRDYLAEPLRLRTIPHLYDSSLACLIVLHAVGSMIKAHWQSKNAMPSECSDTSRRYSPAAKDLEKPKLSYRSWTGGVKSLRHGKQSGRPAKLYAVLPPSCREFYRVLHSCSLPGQLVSIFVYGAVARSQASNGISDASNARSKFQLDAADSPAIQRWIPLGSGTPMLGFMDSVSSPRNSLSPDATRAILLCVRNLLDSKASQKNLSPLVTGTCDLIHALINTKQRDP